VRIDGLEGHGITFAKSNRILALMGPEVFVVQIQIGQVDDIHDMAKTGMEAKIITDAFVAYGSSRDIQKIVYAIVLYHPAESDGGLGVKLARVRSVKVQAAQDAVA
jgi:hypothetical protein